MSIRISDDAAAVIYKIWVPDPDNKFAGEHGDYGDTGSWKPCTFEEAYADGMHRMERAIGYCKEQQHLVARLVLDNVCFSIRPYITCSNDICVEQPKTMGFDAARSHIGRLTDDDAYQGALTALRRCRADKGSMAASHYYSCLNVIENRGRFRNLPDMTAEVRYLVDTGLASSVQRDLQAAESLISNAQFEGRRLTKAEQQDLESRLFSARFSAGLKLRPDRDDKKPSGSRPPEDQQIISQLTQFNTRADELWDMYVVPSGKIGRAAQGISASVTKAGRSLYNLACR